MQQRAHGSPLIVPVLDQHPAARKQSRAAAADDLTQVAQAVLSGRQGGAGLEAQVALVEVGVVVAQVRRVGDDQVKALARRQCLPRRADAGPVRR